MIPRPNPLRERLKQGPALGLWNALAHPFSAEILGQSGVDVVLIDMEHAAFTIDSLVPALIAVRGTAAAGVVRVPSADQAMIKRVMDVGAEGVMIPNINTVDQAREAVAACRYPSHGTRGSGLGMVRAGAYGADVDTYLRPECQPMIIVQTESAEAVDNIAEIAAVDGVEMMFIGPQDLSASMGRSRAYDDPQVRDTILRAEAGIKDAGVWLGSIPSLGRTTRQMLAAGVDFLCAAADLGLVKHGARKIKKDWDASVQ